MGFIKTGLGISKTFRNAARLKEILSVFAKNGFDEFISNESLTGFIPDFVLPSSKLKIRDEISKAEESSWSGIVGYRLRVCFEELGPTFTKLGQLLGSREDMFPAEFIREMHKLRDQVKGIEFKEAKELIEGSLGVSVDKVFKHIDEIPVGTASIGIAYKAELLTGELVVVKVKRPKIRKIVETDIALLMAIIGRVERFSDEVRRLGVSRIINDFAVGIITELNFNIEARNCVRYKEILDECDTDNIFYIPKVYSAYTTADILVIEYLDGIPFSDNIKLNKIHETLEEKITKGLNVFIKSFLQYGFFHADLHGGNFFYLKNGKIGLVDFGLMGSLSKQGRTNFIAIIYSLLTYNFENLTYEFLDVAEYDKVPDVDVLVSDARSSLGPYVGLSVQQTDYSEVLKLMIKALNKHEVYLPREWLTVFRALMTLDGVGKSIGIDIDLFKMLEGDIKDIIKKSVTKDDLLEEGIWVAKSSMSSLRILPRHFKWFMKEWSKKNYALEVINTGYEKEMSSINSSLVFVGMSLLASVFIHSGALFIGSGNYTSIQSIPMVSWVFWSFGIVIIVKSIFSLR